MKKILSLLSLLMLCVVGMNAQTTIYSWESPEGTPIETGGTIAYVNGDGDRLNYLNSGNYTICLNGKKANINDENASANAGKMVITLDQELQTGDEIAITGYITKNQSKKASAYILYENGVEAESPYFSDDENIDATFGGSIATKTVTVSAEAAGSKTITMTRGQTGTNLFITKLVITGERSEVPVVNNKTIGLVPGVWAADGASFAAYAFNSDTENAWFPFVEVSGAYGTQVPESFAKIILVRLKPATAEGFSTDNYGLNWDNKWNQTDDIDFTAVADNTVFTITGYVEGGNSTYTTGSVPTDLTELKATLQKVVNLAKMFGYDTTEAEALLTSDKATSEQLTAALQALATGAKDKASEALSQAKAFFEKFDATASANLAPYFDDAEAALAGTDIDAMLTAAQTLTNKIIEEGQSTIAKVDSYLRKMENETVNKDLDDILAALQTGNLQNVMSTLQQLKADITDAATTYLAVVSKMISDGTAAGKDVSEMQTAYNNIGIVALNYKNGTATLVEMGVALYNLIKAVENYKEANTTYTIAGTKDLTGTEEDWQVVEANNMTLVDGLYTWTAENITVNAENQPQFKVVITDIDDNQTWIPASEEGNDHNWIITPEVVGGEGVYNITITYNAKTKNIGVTGEKVVVEGIIADGTYYIKNVATQKWLAAGADWGTHAVVNETGLDYVIKLADGKYTIDSQVSNGGSSNFLNGSAADGPWNDGGAYGWTVAEVSEGVFTISTGEKFITVGENDKLTFADEATEAAQWTLQTAADRDAANLATLDAATAENGVDATFFIKGADFNRNDLRNNAWTHTRNGGNETFAGPSENRQTYGCEYWNNTFEVSQTIEDLPEGYYTFSIAGFATNGTAKLFANETEADFTNTDAGGKNFREVLDAIAAGEFTGNTTEKVAVIGGTLKIGVKRTENKAADWTTFDNARLTYWGPIPANEFKPAYEEALAAAKDALENADYAAVTGDEKTALEQAIADNTEVDETADAYKAAILALETATSAFTGAKTAYESLAAAKAAMADFDFTAYKYATAEKKTAAETTLNAEATNAADATAKADAVYAAFRQYAESSAMLEGVEGAENFTDRIVNPKAEQTIAEPWVVESQSNNGNMGILSGEPWTDGEGNSTHKYFDGYAWGESAWDATMKQDVKLPKGKYQLTVKSRGSEGLTTFQLFAGEESVDMQHINATGGLFNRGWNDASIEFEVTEAGTVTIGVKGATETVHNWMSFSDFRLVRFETYEPVYTVVGGFDGEGDKDNVLFGKQWDATLESNDMGKGEGTVYTKTFEDIELEAGTTIYYKVVEDHSWNLASWGFNGGNADYVVNEAGKYNVTFTFNPEGLLPNNFNVDCSVVPAGGGDGISSIAAEAQKGNVYNLNGQKVTKAQKGLYIVNGRKQVVR